MIRDTAIVLYNTIRQLYSSFRIVAYRFQLPSVTHNQDVNGYLTLNISETVRDRGIVTTKY